MPTNTSNVSFRVDRQLKQKADSLFAELGLNMTTAFNIFLRQAVRESRIPFEITAVGNAATISAMIEAEHLASDKNTVKYDVEDALQELKS